MENLRQQYLDNGYVIIPNLIPSIKILNLLECLEMMCELIADVGKTLDASIESQLRFNMALTKHFQIAAPGIPTIMDPITKLQGISKGIEAVLERFQVLFQDVNNVSHRINYFNPVTDKYILSRYNTTN